jgi:hypothetical protein
MSEFAQVPDDFGVDYVRDHNGDPLFPMAWERDGATVRIYGVGRTHESVTVDENLTYLRWDTE